MLDEPALGAHQQVWFIYLEEVGRTLLVLEGLYDILSTRFQVNYSQEDLGLVVVGETQNGGRGLIL